VGAGEVAASDERGGVLGAMRRARRSALRRNIQCLPATNDVVEHRGHSDTFYGQRHTPTLPPIFWFRDTDANTLLVVAFAAD